MLELTAIGHLPTIRTTSTWALSGRKQMHGFWLPWHYIRLICDLLSERGVDTDAWLAASKVNPASLCDEGDGIAYPTFHGLIESALRVTNEPALGLHMGERMRFNSHGMLGYATLSSGTLRQAVDVLARFMAVRTTLVALHREQAGSDMRLRFESTLPLGGIEAAVLEAIVLTVKNVVDQLTMGMPGITRACFSLPTPSYASLSNDLFKCEVKYEQGWTGLEMPFDSLDRPLGTADLITFAQAEQMCQRALETQGYQPAMRDEVRRLLITSPDGFPTLDAVAAVLRMTSRTLHRRLQEEGTSFHALLENVRHLTAVAQLKEGRLSIQQIAHRLGYADQANFRRAFKRWTALSPSDYRKQHLAGLHGQLSS